MGTGFGFFLIGAGAVLLFAVRTGSWAGLNLHVVGVIVLTFGVVWLLLLPGGGLRRRRTGCAAGSIPAASMIQASAISGAPRP